jgi:hypothetical protein
MLSGMSYSRGLEHIRRVVDQITSQGNFTDEEISSSFTKALSNDRIFFEAETDAWYFFDLLRVRILDDTPTGNESDGDLSRECFWIFLKEKSVWKIVELTWRYRQYQH